MEKMFNFNNNNNKNPNSKRPTCDRSEKSPDIKKKRRRQSINLELKLLIIKQYEEGNKRKAAIANDLNLPESTVRTILRDKDKYLEAAQAATPFTSTLISRVRSGPLRQMEALLYNWMEEQMQSGTHLTQGTIQAMAATLFETLKEGAGDDITIAFSASNGWYRRFKQRISWLSESTSSSTEPASTSKEEIAVQAFITNLDEVISDGDYQPAQIFNVAKTELLWRGVLQEFRSDRLNVLLGGNMAGFKLKPFVIQHLMQPRSSSSRRRHQQKLLNPHSESAVGIDFRASRKLRITHGVFHDWINHYFMPQVRTYCEQNGIPMKVLLILDSTFQRIRNHHHSDPKHVQLMYLPADVKRAIQPMDQGPLVTFKANYLYASLDQAVKTMNIEFGTSLTKFWQDYEILDCTKHLSTAWNAIPKECITGMWKNCMRRHNIKSEYDSASELNVITNRIVELASQMSMECDVKDVEYWLEYELKGNVSSTEEQQDDTLYSDYMRVPKQEQVNDYEEEETMISGNGDLENEEQEDDEEDEDENKPEKIFTLKGLSEGFTQLDKLLKHFEAMDSNSERFSQFEHSVQCLFEQYHNIYKDKMMASNSEDSFNKSDDVE